MNAPTTLPAPAQSGETYARILRYAIGGVAMSFGATCALGQLAKRY